MKYTVRIDDIEYEVEINDLRARPIIAIVDGTPIEVLPANGHSGAPAAVNPSAGKAPAAARPALQTPRPPSDASAAVVRAPIPGVILDILVKPGQSVEQGQELFILEAMKMKNTIRSPRAGMIAEILAAPGATVSHNAPIVSFAES